MIQLNKKQQEYYEAIRWLLDKNNFRREGRTTLLAKVYIDIAIQNRNRWISLQDHHSSREGKESIFYAVQNLSYKYNKLLFLFEFNKRLFKFRLRCPKSFEEYEK